jgi:hypothetical protein
MVPANILQQVVTWNMADLEIFQNNCCVVSTANTRFRDPENFPGNLGSSVSYETQPRFVSQDSLVVNFQEIQQNSRTLTVNKQENVSYAGTAEQIVFNNLEEYTTRLGDAAMAELASKVESDVTTLFETIPYRFFGNGTNPINSAQQLAQMIANFRSYSSAPGILKVYLDLQSIPAIVSTMQNQFTLERNNENAMSWMVGNWAGVEFYSSNLLPIHFSGTVGNATYPSSVLTVLSTNDPTGNNITQITWSGAGTSDVNAIKAYDHCQFVNYGGATVPYWLTWTGHNQTSLPVQLQITADAASDGSGHVTTSIYPALCATAGNMNQNIPINIVAGMTAQFVPSAKVGCAVSDNALYVAMPKLPSTYPFPSSTATDEDTTVSVRLYYGVIPFQNVYGWTRDVIWGKDMVPQNSMAMFFPLTQNNGIGM